MLQAPPIPLVLLSSVTVIDHATTAIQARLWQEEIETLYNKHYRNPEPTWTWEDVHDCDRDALIELEEVIRASVAPPLDLELVSSFMTPEWRAPYWKQLFSPCAVTVDLSSATIKDIPLTEHVQWQRAKVIQSSDGDLSDVDESCLFADWKNAQDFYRRQAIHATPGLRNAHNRYALADQGTDAGLIWSVGGVWSASLLDQSPTLMTGPQADAFHKRHPNAHIVDVIVFREAHKAYTVGVNSAINHNERSTPEARQAAHEAGIKALVRAGFSKHALDIVSQTRPSGD